MFPYPIAKPQNCDIQMFYADRTLGNLTQAIASGCKTWIKPTGVSHVYIMLIGSSTSNNTDSTGRGSGSVTVWYGAAQNVPDKLLIAMSTATGTSYIIREITSATTADVLFTAASPATNNTNGGSALSANYFTASGFFKSTAGDNADTGVVSSTTFLAGGSNPANYGYGNGGTQAMFQFQPIIVGVSRSSAINTVNVSNSHAVPGVGIRGSAAVGQYGGSGFCLIASW